MFEDISDKESVGCDVEDQEGVGAIEVKPEALSESEGEVDTSVNRESGSSEPSPNSKFKTSLV